MAVTITRTAWTDDDGSGTTGTVINNAVKTELYGQIDTALALLFPLTGGALASTVRIDAIADTWLPVFSSGIGIEMFYAGTSDYGGIIAYDRSGSAYKSLRLDGSVLALNSASGGNVGIGTIAPTNPLQMASGAYVSAGGVWTNASSRTLKDQIADLPASRALDAFARLQPVTFVYKANPTEAHVGFIAEDVPDLVATGDRRSLAAMDIVAVLTKVVQVQQAMMTDLQARVDQLEALWAPAPTAAGH